MKALGGFRERAAITLVLASLVTVAALALAACGGTNSTETSPRATGSSSAPSSVAATSPLTTVPALGEATPTPLGPHQHTTREVKAMALAQATVDQDRWAYDTSRYRGRAPDIVGYVVEWQRRGVVLVATVVSATGKTSMWGDGGSRALNPFFNVTSWRLWQVHVHSSDAEYWASTTAGGSLRSSTRKASPSFLPTGDPFILAYYVGWPTVFPSEASRWGLTMLVPADLQHGVIPPTWGPGKW